MCISIVHIGCFLVSADGLSGLRKFLWRFPPQSEERGFQRWVLMENPEISGIEYQQGTLQGYEVREYLLSKWEHMCAYCKKKGVPLQVEHVMPRSRGGSNRLSNLVMACEKCNKKKGGQKIEEFLRKDPDLLKKIKGQLKVPLKDAAALNSIRKEIARRLRVLGLGVNSSTGAQTKFNRTLQLYGKYHFVDAACVGDRGENVLIPSQVAYLKIKASGRGFRRMRQPNKYGFTVGKSGKSVKSRMSQRDVYGFRNGDIVKAVVPEKNPKTQKVLKTAGTHVGKVIIRKTGSFTISGSKKIEGISYRYCSLLQRFDGYSYECHRVCAQEQS